MAPQNNPINIEFIIRKAIEKQGRISVAQFMETVLAHSTMGYYSCNNAIGANNDFITSAEISQVFGEMVGVWCATMWQKMGSPTSFMLVELGPGRGTLMSDLLRATKSMPQFHQAIDSVNLIEISEPLKQLQINKFQQFSSIKFAWHKNVNTLPDKPMLLIANEFFDALPINQYIKGRNQWYENMVSVAAGGDELVFEKYQVTKYMQQILETEYGYLKRGNLVEISNESIVIMKKIGKLMSCRSGAIIHHCKQSKATNTTRYLTILAMLISQLMSILMH
jgi:NADH dehydrogenase [ubiquinone] 1 alpha subcomplex assembly factor 7